MSNPVLQPIVTLGVLHPHVFGTFLGLPICLTGRGRCGGVCNTSGGQCDQVDVAAMLQ
jgi:hypothetical protein